MYTGGNRPEESPVDELFEKPKRHTRRDFAFSTAELRGVGAAKKQAFDYRGNCSGIRRICRRGCHCTAVSNGAMHARPAAAKSTTSKCAVFFYDERV